MDTTLKGFNDYTESELSTNLPDGLYHMKVREAVVGEWPSGDIRFDIQTVVVSGAKAGKFGPRHTWNFDAYDGEGYSYSEEDRWQTFIKDIRAMRDGAEVVVSDIGPTEAVLGEIARQIKGDEFVAKIGTDKNDYNRIVGKLSAMSAPPKGFNGDEVEAAFDVNDV